MGAFETVRSEISHPPLQGSVGFEQNPGSRYWAVMVTELPLVTLQRLAVIVVVPVVPSPVVVPEEPEMDEMIAVFEMFQVTSLTTFWFPLPLKIATAVNVIVVAVPAGTESGLAPIVRLVTGGQTEIDAVAGVSAW